jgi:hypothetical protein
MRPRVLRRPPEPEESTELVKESDIIASRKGLQDILDMLERVEAFAPSKGEAIMCKQCGMPCYDEDNGTRRRAYPAAGHGVICGDCLFG